jgi:hypothetical protein
MQAASAEPLAVERISAITRERFCSDYLERGRPVVISDAARDWPALASWTRRHLHATTASKPIPVDVYENGDFFATGGALGHRKRTHLAFSEYLDRSAAPTSTRYYAPDLELTKYFPELALDVTRLSLLPSDADPRHFLFAGHDAVTAGHFHPFTHALTCQVTGSKRFVLYPPSASPNLYPNVWFLPAFFWSRVNFLDPDYRRFPRLRAARPLACTLNPGEAIFIPVHWWHWTQGFDFSVSVLVSWKAKLSAWHFPTPGFKCAFARLVLPAENALRAMLSHGKRALSSASRNTVRDD